MARPSPLNPLFSFVPRSSKFCAAQIKTAYNIGFLPVDADHDDGIPSENVVPLAVAVDRIVLVHEAHWSSSSSAESEFLFLVLNLLEFVALEVMEEDRGRPHEHQEDQKQKSKQLFVAFLDLVTTDSRRSLWRPPFHALDFDITAKEPSNMERKSGPNVTTIILSI